MQGTICSPEPENTQFTRESAMIYPRRAPEVTTRRQIPELHHRGCTVNVVTLLGTVVVGNVVLPIIRRHAVQKGMCVGQRVRA